MRTPMQAQLLCVRAACDARGVAARIALSPSSDMAAAPSAVHLRRCVVSPAGRHSASLIFLHGSGDSGQGLRQWIKQVLNQDLTFQHIKIIYPTAPSRYVTLNFTSKYNSWNKIYICAN